MMEAYTTAVIRDATLKRYNTLAERFVILVKFFKIVFDKTFLEMAVFGKSYVRQVTTFCAHPLIKFDDRFKDVLLRFSQIEHMDVFQNLEGMNMAKRKYDPAPQLLRLLKVYETNEDYLFEADTDLEKEMDVNLEAMVSLIEPKSTKNKNKIIMCPSDVHMFVKWSQEVDESLAAVAATSK